MNSDHTLFYVDDDPEDVSLFTDALSELGSDIKLITFSSGVRFLESLSESTIMPNWLMLDLNMPGVNGMHVLKEMKKRPDWKNIPVVIFSTADSKEIVNECLQNGADMFITKPRSFEGLKHTIQHVLSADYKTAPISGVVFS